MNDFVQALEWLKMGLKVKRRKWQKTYWSFCSEVGPVWSYNCSSFNGKVIDAGPAVLHQEHVRANDWEIYDE